MAWAAIVAIAAITANRLLLDNDGGWFAYAPNTGAAIVPDRTEIIWREALVWLGAVAAIVVGSSARVCCALLNGVRWHAYGAAVSSG